MKIFSTRQIRQADEYTIKNESVSSLDLMERAAGAFVEKFIKHFTSDKKILVLCGPGNNGGDGLAIARLLFHRGYRISVYLFRKTGSEDFNANLDRLTALTGITLIDANTPTDIPTDGAIVIDAIFGSGLSGPLNNVFADVIKKINDSDCTVVSVDIPSGMFGDEANSHTDVIIRADYTYTFQFPKLNFLLPEYGFYVPNWSVLDIGLHPHFIEKEDTPYTLFDRQDAFQLLKDRFKYAHKGDFGHSLFVGGSYGKIGAAILASKACLRAGTGLLTALIPGCGYTALQAAVPEAMVITSENDLLAEMPVTELSQYSAIGIGPGMGLAEKTEKFFRQFLEHVRKPSVFDADALNLLSKNPELLESIPKGSVLTPHPGEFRRLFGVQANSHVTLATLKSEAERLGVIIILKGAYTAVASDNGKVSFNSTGNPGMATGGSGDVLTGIILGLLAQGYEGFDAARLGVYIHGLAGDLALESLHPNSLVASDIINSLGHAFLSIRK